jgi:hypothetical protein
VAPAAGRAAMRTVMGVTVGALRVLRPDVVEEGMSLAVEEGEAVCLVPSPLTMPSMTGCGSGCGSGCGDAESGVPMVMLRPETEPRVGEALPVWVWVRARNWLRVRGMIQCCSGFGCGGLFE